MCVSRAGWDGALAGPRRYGEQFAPHCPGERSVKLSIGETSSISLWLLAINYLPRLFQAISHRKLVLGLTLPRLLSPAARFAPSLSEAATSQTHKLQL